MNKQLKNSILLVLLSIIWGFAFAFQSIGSNHLGPLTFLAVRCLIAVLVLGIFVLFIRKDDDLTDNKYSIKLGLLCGVFTCGGSIFQQIAIGYTTAANCSFITSLYVVLVPIISLFFGQKTDKKIWLCVAMEIVGLYLLCIKKGVSVNIGDVYTLVSAILFAFQIIVIGRGGKKVDTILFSFAQFVVCMVVGGIGALLFERPINFAGIKAAAMPLLYTGVISSALGITLQVNCQKYVNPTIASLIMCLESVFGAVSGWLILNQTLSARELLGCAIMFAAIVISQLPSKKK